MEQFPFNSDGFNRSVLNLYKDVFMAIAKLFRKKRKRTLHNNPEAYLAKEPEKVYEVVEEMEEVLT